MQSIEMFGGGFSLDREKMDNIEKWLSRPILLKHGELANTRKIGDLDLESLVTKLYWLGYELCDRDSSRYSMLAMNQIPKDIMIQLGIAEENKAIYRGFDLFESEHLDVNYLGYLFVNPVVDKKNRPSRGLLESCGSILNNSIGMYINRPTELSFFVDAIYSPRLGLVKKNGENLISMTGVEAAYFDHEMSHLEGKTILDDPDKILDPRHFLTGLDNGKRYDRWLGWEEGRFFIIDSNGNKCWQGLLGELLDIDC